jgi:hypothetical protein
MVWGLERVRSILMLSTQLKRAILPASSRKNSKTIWNTFRCTYLLSRAWLTYRTLIVTPAFNRGTTFRCVGYLLQTVAVYLSVPEMLLYEVSESISNRLRHVTSRIFESSPKSAVGAFSARLGGTLPVGENYRRAAGFFAVDKGVASKCETAFQNATYRNIFFLLISGRSNLPFMWRVTSSCEGRKDDEMQRGIFVIKRFEQCCF